MMPASCWEVALSIVHVTYSYVEPGRPAARCSPKIVSPELAEYLEEHLDWLLRGANGHKTPPAEFLTQDARDRFARLGTGTQTQFIAAAQQFLDRLMANMDARSKRGFFVAVRRREDGTRPAVVHAAVMKLDVSDKTAAAVAEQDGAPTLEAFRGLLDTPGPRPVRELDPTRHALQQELTADGILVRGRSEDIDDKVRVRPRQGGGWRIQIDVDEEPRQKYK